MWFAPPGLRGREAKEKDFSFGFDEPKKKKEEKMFGDYEEEDFNLYDEYQDKVARLGSTIGCDSENL